MAFLEGFIDTQQVQHAVAFVGEQISPANLQIRQVDPRNTEFAVADDEGTGRVTDPIDNEFEAQMNSMHLGSIFPDQGVSYSGTSDATGSIYPNRVNMRWIQDNAAMGIGTSR